MKITGSIVLKKLDVKEVIKYHLNPLNFIANQHIVVVADETFYFVTSENIF